MAFNHVKEHFWGYAIPLFFTVAWIAFLAVMDGRHDAKGTAAETMVRSELRAVRREQRQLTNYLEQASSEQYDPARRATLRELEDEEEELEESLEALMGEKN